VTNGLTVDAYLATLRAEVDRALDVVLPADAPPLIADAMRYSLVAGGKRLRPCLTLAAAEAVGGRLGLDAVPARQRALPAACAVEMVHTYSLIHDDLPAMDDDDLRRGRPTSHVVFGDGLAVLAGDGLLTEAFRVLAEWPAPASGSADPTAAARLTAIGVLAASAGAAGMVGGQAIDLEAAGRVKNRPPDPLDRAALEDMHRRKTGALIRAAAMLGAIMAGADAALTRAIEVYATELGLAFQIIDDVLDVEGSDAALGKTAGKDAAAGKPTYPALHGLEGSRRLAAESVGRACRAVDAAQLPGRLTDIAEWSLHRRH
jgi:geranylgeranyl pyrophosphate synthase